MGIFDKPGKPTGGTVPTAPPVADPPAPTPPPADPPPVPDEPVILPPPVPEAPPEPDPPRESTLLTLACGHTVRTASPVATVVFCPEDPEHGDQAVVSARELGEGE